VLSSRFIRITVVGQATQRLISAASCSAGSSSKAASRSAPSSARAPAVRGLDFRIGNATLQAMIIAKWFRGGPTLASDQHPRAVLT